MNDNKKYIIENLLYEKKIENILILLNTINKTSYLLKDIIYIELINCSSIKNIPKELINLKILKINNCKNFKKIPNLPSLKQIEFIKPKIIHINHKKIF